MSVYPKKKICVVVINRANYGRLKSVLQAIKDHPDLELQTVVGSSMLIYRYGKAIDVMEADGFKVDEKLYMNVEGEQPVTMAKSAGMGLISAPDIFLKLQPDVVLVNADRFEIAPIALAASYMNIPIAHTLGGEVTGTIDEHIRHAVTKLAHFHFVAHPKAAERVIQMGENKNNVFVVGNPSLDLIADADLTLDPEVFIKKYGGTGAILDFSKPYLLFLQHPVTTEYGQGLKNITETIAAIHSLKMQTIILWPNIDAGSDEISKGLRKYKEQYQPPFVHFYRNFAVEDYLKVLANATCIIGNSSSGIMEAGFLGVPAINIGTRQAGSERGDNVVDVPYNRSLIKKAIEDQLLHGRYERDTLFGSGEAGKKIAEILATHQVPVQKIFQSNLL